MLAPGVKQIVLPLEEAGEGRTRSFKVAALREGWAWTQREWSLATQDTGVGNSARATAEKGRRFLAAVSSKIAGFLVALAATDLEDLYE